MEAECISFIHFIFILLLCRVCNLLNKLSYQCNGIFNCAGNVFIQIVIFYLHDILLTEHTAQITPDLTLSGS